MSKQLKLIIFAVLLFLGVLYFYKKYKVAPAMDFTKLTLSYPDGEPFEWSSLKGKKLVVSFGASWCVNCRDEMAEIAKIRNSKLSDVEIVIISDEDPQDIMQWAQSKPYPYLFLKMQQRFPQIGINAIPVTYIVNKELKVMQEEVGYVDWSDEGTVEDILKLME